MVSGGNATVFVSNMDASVRFYTEVLGCRLTNRFGDHWATVAAGSSLTIGRHPVSPEYPSPGTKGAVVLGLETDVPIDKAVARLVESGARIKGEIRHGSSGSFATFSDPDGNEFYLWELNRKVVPESELMAHA